MKVFIFYNLLSFFFIKVLNAVHFEMNKHGTWHSHKSQVWHLIKQMRTEAICSIYYMCALSRLHWLWNKETGIKPGWEPAAGDASFSRESDQIRISCFERHWIHLNSESLQLFSHFNYSSSMAEFLYWIHPATFFPRLWPDMAGYWQSTNK